MQNQSVLISGAGIAGPTLAYWLFQDGFDPTLVESAPALRTGGYMIDFWGVGYDVADRMGLLPALDRVGYRIRELKIVDATGRRIAGLDVSAFQSATHGRLVSLLRGDLAQQIYEPIASKVETIFGDSITSIVEDEHDALVTFEHAPARHVDLVVGADGLHSTVRRLAFEGANAHEMRLGYYTAAFTADAYPHRDEGAYVSFCVPGRQVARYALRDGRSAFFFVFAQEGDAVEHDDESAQRAALHRTFAGIGWETDAILTALDAATDFYFDVVAQIRLDTWSRGRVVLLGDAAYCPSLLAGQGAALAMAGAYVLARELSISRGNYRSAFAAYQRQFKPFMDVKQRTVTGYRSWFAPRTAAGVWLRNQAVRFLALPGLGNFLLGRSFGDRFTLDGGRSTLEAGKEIRG